MGKLGTSITRFHCIDEGELSYLSLRSTILYEDRSDSQARMVGPILSKRYEKKTK